MTISQQLETCFIKKEKKIAVFANTMRLKFELKTMDIVNTREIPVPIKCFLQVEFREGIFKIFIKQEILQFFRIS